MIKELSEIVYLKNILLVNFYHKSNSPRELFSGGGWNGELKLARNDLNQEFWRN